MTIDTAAWRHRPTPNCGPIGGGATSAAGALSTVTWRPWRLGRLHNTVGEIRAPTFCVRALPIERFSTAEHLYSFTGLAPARYESATIRKARAISLQPPASDAMR